MSSADSSAVIEVDAIAPDSQRCLCRSMATLRIVLGHETVYLCQACLLRLHLQLHTFDAPDKGQLLW